MKSFIAALGLFLVFSSVCFAGWGSYSREPYKFTYEVEGEIEVKPDTAVLPLTITVSSKSYSESLKKVKTILDGIGKDVNAIDEKVYSTSPSDFFRSQENGRKILDVSFFGGGDDASSAALVFNIFMAFDDGHDFWQRAEFIAKANDYVSSLSKKYEKNDAISVSPEKIYYEISDVERYRADIIKSIYSKAQAMAKIVADAEGVKLRVDEVKFDQRINKEFINFSRASLGINAQIDFTFDQPSNPEK
jgi:hypothetical protein